MNTLCLREGKYRFSTLYFLKNQATEYILFIIELVAHIETFSNVKGIISLKRNVIDKVIEGSTTGRKKR